MVSNTINQKKDAANGFTRKLIDDIEKTRVPESAGINAEELISLIDIYKLDIGKLAIVMFKLGFSRGLKMSSALELADSLD